MLGQKTFHASFFKIKAAKVVCYIKTQKQIKWSIHIGFEDEL